MKVSSFSNLDFYDFRPFLVVFFFLSFFSFLLSRLFSSIFIDVYGSYADRTDIREDRNAYTVVSRTKMQGAIAEERREHTKTQRNEKLEKKTQASSHWKLDAIHRITYK